MPVLRIELETTREAANTFHARAIRGEPFITERDMVIDQVWTKGYTPTGITTAPHSSDCSVCSYFATSD